MELVSTVLHSHKLQMMVNHVFQVSVQVPKSFFKMVRVRIVRFIRDRPLEAGDVKLIFVQQLKNYNQMELAVLVLYIQELQEMVKRVGLHNALIFKCFLKMEHAGIVAIIKEHKTNRYVDLTLVGQMKDCH